MMVQQKEILARHSSSRREHIPRARLGKDKTKAGKTARPQTQNKNETNEQHVSTTQPTHEPASTEAQTTQEQEPPAAQMDLTTLMRHCACESERFYRGQQHDTSYSYELFRRALVDRSEAAWETLVSAL